MQVCRTQPFLGRAAYIDVRFGFPGPISRFGLRRLRNDRQDPLPTRLTSVPRTYTHTHTLSLSPRRTLNVSYTADGSCAWCRAEQDSLLIVLRIGATGTGSRNIDAPIRVTTVIEVIRTHPSHPLRPISLVGHHIKPRP